MTLSLAGCTAPADPASPAIPSGDSSPEDSGAAPSDRGAELPPSARVTGLPGMWLTIGGVGVVPTHGDDASVLLVSTRGDLYPHYPLTFLVPGSIPRGEHAVLDLWDGRSTYADQLGSVQLAGDVDDDGHLDLWFPTELRLGPLLGRALEPGAGADAYVDDGGRVGAAGFDADGDGHEDVLFQSCCQTAWIHHGPFSGRIAGAYAADASPDVTWLGDMSGCAESIAASVLRDHLAPGRDAVAMGIEGGCGRDTTVWPLQQPRGTHLHEGDEVGFASIGGTAPMWFESTGDLDGDGIGEAIYGDWLYSRILRGPLHGNAVQSPEAFTQVNGHAQAAIADLNGDGIEELVGGWIHSLAPYDVTWMLVLSPYDDPIDWSVGVDLGHRDDAGVDFGRLDGDLDG
ncbi:MAG: VCBS repeat-containing protein, partial [Myxococcota bacterium]